MFTVYILTHKQLGDRIFEEIPVVDLQLEAEGMSLEEFQNNFNKGKIDSRNSFIRFVSY